MSIRREIIAGLGSHGVLSVWETQKFPELFTSYAFTFSQGIMKRCLAYKGFNAFKERCDLLQTSKVFCRRCYWRK